MENLIIYTYKKKLRKHVFKITKDNLFIIKFMLDTKLEETRKRLRELKEKGIIKNTSKNPKCLFRTFEKEVQGLIIARKSLLDTKKYLSQQTKRFITN